MSEANKKEGKVWTEPEIKEMLVRSQYAVERGIVAIWRKQTEYEKSTETTKDSNGVGFNSFHANRGTYYANHINKGKHLTGKHIKQGRELILHYVKQLTKISNKEI